MMSTPLRPIHVAILGTLAALAFAALSSLSVPRAGADAPLVLGSEHVGMTSEGMVEAEHQAQTEQRVNDAIRDSEWVDDDDGEGALSFSCPDPVASAPGPALAPVTTDADGVVGYDSCVEVAIRGGNGFKSASGVCQTLYPEPLDALTLDEAPVPDETQPLDEAKPFNQAQPLEEPPPLEETARVHEDLSRQATQY